MRLVLVLAWALILLALLLPVIRRALATTRSRPRAITDELVKDPVCQTYVVRSRAVRSEAGGGPVYFCSTECARRFASPGA